MRQAEGERRENQSRGKETRAMLVLVLLVGFAMVTWLYGWVIVLVFEVADTQ